MEVAERWRDRLAAGPGEVSPRPSGEEAYLSWLVQQESTVAVALRWGVVVLVVPLGAWLAAPAPLAATFWVVLGGFVGAYALFTFLIWRAGSPKTVMPISLLFSGVDVSLASFAIAATGGPRSVFHVLLALLLVRAIAYHPDARRILALSGATFVIYFLALAYTSEDLAFVADGYFWFQVGLLILIVPVSFIAIEAVDLQKRRALGLTADLERALAENRQKQHQLEEALSDLRFVANEVDKASNQLATAANQLSASAQEVNASAERVTATIQQMARGAEVQAEQVTASSRSMTEMSAAVGDVASGAQGAAQAATEVAQRAEQGGQAAQEATQKMQQLKETISTSAQVVQGLSEKFHQITKIVDTINRFADQTTLLALNAAIEAARAGEEGKSFAVIASEIRGLAESSVRSAGEIADLVRDIEREVARAVGSMEAGTAEIETGVVAMERAREALEQIIAAVQRASALAQEISLATREQQAASEAMVKAVSEVATVAERNASGAEHASHAVAQQSASIQVISNSAQELAKMATRLHVLVAKMKAS